MRPGRASKCCRFRNFGDAVLGEANQTAAQLFYAHDPMCSWCWGFRRVYLQFADALPRAVTLTPLLGGLAEDSDAPMPATMQNYLQQTWRAVAARTGAKFNHDFWRHCKPRRSTWPACRAALAARAQNREAEMVGAIQRGYYLQARNPSDEPTLLEFAAEIGLDTGAFQTALHSAEIRRQLAREIATARALGMHGFPSLVLVRGDSAAAIGIDYADAQPMLDAVANFLRGGGGSFDGVTASHA